MFPLLGSIFTGGASLLGSMFSADQSGKNTEMQIGAQSRMQEDTQAFNAEQAEINRQFQAQMSNSAYQRASQDMQKAGLNPAMMFGSAGSASTPSGGAASVSTPTAPMPQNRSPWEGLGDAVGKAINTAVSLKTMDKMTEEIASMKTQQNLNDSLTKLRTQETETERETTLKRAVETVLDQLKLPKARVGAKEGEAIEKIPNWLFNVAAQGGYLGEHAARAIEPVSQLISGAKGVKSLFPEKITRERSHQSGYDGAGNAWGDSFETIWRNRSR